MALQERCTSVIVCLASPDFIIVCEQVGTSETMDGTAGSDIESGIGSSSATGVSGGDEGEGRNAGDPIYGLGYSKRKVLTY